MKSHIRFVFLTPLLLIPLILASCDPKEAALYPPEADFYVNPPEGNTTTIFKFNTSPTNIEGTQDTMLFFRWDWDSDGVWDTHFSRSRNFDYRFRAKGTYNVTMEASSNGGMRDTISTTINVVQGFSAPRPVLNISPESGNIKTVFTFDASTTADDEDSLNLLEFRWDYEGDGFYDTPWSSEPVITHTYANAGPYNPAVIARDPSQLSASAKKELRVSLNNPELVVDFTWNPQDGSTADVYVFDGSTSYDPNDPDNTFTYRWDFNADGYYDTDKSENPTVEFQYEEEGERSVRLEITDKDGLINTGTKDLFVAHANRAPEASFFAGADYGNTTTVFYFDASGVKDYEDWDYQLQVRWDFDSDGNWDTGYSSTKTATHKYGVAGQFLITMEVMDSEGFTDQASLSVSATEGTNETGLIIDEDSGDTYGTVKIGNQWWMAENLKNTTNRNCYANNPVYCGIYGGMYNWSSAMAGSDTEKARGLCPQGWHIPTVSEWQALFDHLGAETARIQLEKGGPTDFNLVYAGQMSTSGSQYAGEIVNFWTSTAGAGDNAWTYSLQKDKEQIWKLSLGRAYRNTVRCIKN